MKFKRGVDKPHIEALAIARQKTGQREYACWNHDPRERNTYYGFGSTPEQAYLAWRQLQVPQ